ncbi:hypothetical protein QUF80_13995 [Desulfococcaceae bacterium HSG8]|nr:hypothetical protein [Desulfococcaceae bacterium HSG8]
MGDVILGLKALTGLASSVNLNADVDNDNKIGIPEVTYTLVELSK